jgi:hypothetical protein
MDIIKLIIEHNNELLQGTTNIKFYKEAGKVIANRDKISQFQSLKFLLPKIFENNENLGLESLTIISYIEEMKKINIHKLNKILLKAFMCNVNINILKFLDTYIDLDFTCIFKKKFSILSCLLITLFNSEDYEVLNIIPVISYIIEKGNYKPEKEDYINVPLYIEKLYNQNNIILNIHAKEWKMKNPSKISLESIQIIEKLVLRNKIDDLRTFICTKQIEKEDIKDIYNRPLYLFSPTIEIFEYLFFGNKKDLYKNIYYSSEDNLSYNILEESIRSNDFNNILDNYLGYVKINDKVKQNNQNNKLNNIIINKMGQDLFKSIFSYIF